jgi:hypothetical protein
MAISSCNEFFDEPLGHLLWSCNSASWFFILFLLRLGIGFKAWGLRGFLRRVKRPHSLRYQLEAPTHRRGIVSIQTILIVAKTDIENAERGQEGWICQVAVLASSCAGEYGKSNSVFPHRTRLISDYLTITEDLRWLF